MNRALMLTLLLLVATACHAQSRSLPPPLQTAYEQRLHAQLRLQLRFTDDSGRSVQLRQYFGDRPVVLVLGYYHCPNLCSTLMEGVLPALAAVDLAPDAYQLVGVSIDPNETAELAARKKISYAPMRGRRGGDLHLLTGGTAAIAQLTASAGFHYAYDPTLGQYTHPAGFLIATPEGRISQYFLGLRFDPQALRLALVDASAGRVGSPVDRLLLLCTHYDPAVGRYSVQAMTAVRVAGLVALAALAGWIWRQRGGQRGGRMRGRRAP